MLSGSQQSAIENIQLLITEYKEKNDTLSGLVAKYQAFANENEKLKTEFTNERELLRSKVNKLDGQNKISTGPNQGINPSIGITKKQSFN